MINSDIQEPQDFDATAETHTPDLQAPEPAVEFSEADAPAVAETVDEAAAESAPEPDTVSEAPAEAAAEPTTDAPETAAETSSEETEAQVAEPGEIVLAKSFHDFKLKEELQKALDEVGYTAPTPIQARTIPHLLGGHDVIGCAQTGTGKTAAFAVPVLEKLSGKAQHPEALIITPTRELAEQIFQNLLDYSRYLPTRSVVIYGGVPSRGQESQLKKGCDIVIATPGRLLDLLNQRSLRLYDVKFLILDEADRMLDMGFIPDIENIMTYVPRKRQTLLFSATMPPEIEKLARKITVPDAEMIVEGIRSAAAETVTQKLYHVEEQNKFPLLLSLLKNADNEMTSTIIFSRTKVGTANLAKQLINKGIPAATIHSNLTQIQRQASLDGFKQGIYKILVATDIAARGLDITQVSHVINFDTPTHPEDYVHRIGRTGRAQATGEAYTFCSPEERKYLRNIERLIGRSVPVAEDNTMAPDRSRDDHAEKTSRKRTDRPERSDRPERPARADRYERNDNYDAVAVREPRREGRNDSRPESRNDSRRGERSDRPAFRPSERPADRPANRTERDDSRRGGRRDRERPEPLAEQRFEPTRVEARIEPKAERPARPARGAERPARAEQPLRAESPSREREPASENRRGRHENRMKEPGKERRPQASQNAEPGQAALNEIRRGRSQRPAAYEPAPAPERRPTGLKPTEFFPGQGRQRQADQVRLAEPAPEQPQHARKHVPGTSRSTAAPQHAAYHASRYLSADDVDYIDDI